MVIIEYNRSVRELNFNHYAFILSSFCIKKIMKRKYKKTKKGHARRNATIKRRKRTRRQRGGAKVILQNMDVSDDFARNGQEYKVIQVEYDDHDSLQHVFIGKARASIMHQTCGAAIQPLVGRVGEPRCDIISYQAVDGPGILASYNPNGTIRSTYHGNFGDGKMHGRGKYTFHTHPVFQEYEGDFNDGEMHGKGRMMMKNKDVYVGDFQHDLMHGRGALTFTFKEDGSQDGSRYEGDFDNGRMHGHGKMHDDEENVVFDGEFKNNEPQYRLKRRKGPSFFDP